MSVCNTNHVLKFNIKLTWIRVVRAMVHQDNLRPELEIRENKTEYRKPNPGHDT